MTLMMMGLWWAPGHAWAVQAVELSYEELCAAHTEARMAAAAAAEVQTELASRVACWRSKIAPVLEEQDARGDFDIHTCAFNCMRCMAEF